MCKFILLASAMAFALSSYASEKDSIQSPVGLQEVVIQAPKIVRKADMDVLYPSATAIENSKSGLQVLKNLMIPSVIVNEVLGTVKTAGGNVQLRINGREASIEQVRQLLPETVKRVEWIDNPGLRYNGAIAVLNIIVSNPEVGGSFMGETMAALNLPFDHFDFSLKLNHGRSQFGINPSFKLSNKISCYREYSETFTYLDGSSLTRTETPTGGYLSDTNGALDLEYSYIVPDTTTFYVSLYGFKRWSSAWSYDGIMSLSNGANDIHLHDMTDDAGFQPRLDVYLEQRFKRNQTIAVDLSACLTNWHNWRDYSERDTESLDYITDVHTSIRDRNQAYSLSANYIKKWAKSRLTVGASYTANRNRSTYENLDNAVFHQRQDRLYFYGEYFQRLNKFTITAGLGSQYISYKFRETGGGENSWNIRPKATLTYRHGPVSSFNLSFSLWPTAPTLSQTNSTPQQIDGFQWRIGNPDLKTSKTHQATFRYNMTLPRLYAQFAARGYVCNNAITPYRIWDGDRLIVSYENSKGYRDLSLWIAPQIEVIPKWLTLSGRLQYDIENSRGNGYNLNNNNLSGNVVASLSHWGFDLTLQYQQDQKSLWGETIAWSETISIATLSFNWRDWQFTAGVFCPFNKYDRGSQSLNKYNSNLMHIRTDMMPMPFIQLNYNLQWGRQKSDVYKLVNSDSSVERSSAAEDSNNLVIRVFRTMFLKKQSKNT